MQKPKLSSLMVWSISLLAIHVASILWAGQMTWSVIYNDIGRRSEELLFVLPLLIGSLIAIIYLISLIILIIVRLFKKKPLPTKKEWIVSALVILLPPLFIAIYDFIIMNVYL